MGRAFRTQRWNRNTHRILVGNPQGKAHLKRHKHRWEDNIKIVLRGIEWGGMNCINLV
jgi:hypothetical protein